MSDSTFEIEGIDDFRNTLHRMNTTLGTELDVWMDALGFQFLEEIQNEIIRIQVVDTRRLLNSFGRGGEGSLWELNRTKGTLTLLIGTNVEYAKPLNDGHWTNPKGVNQRWVPGYWKGDRFTYDPHAKTGMLLKQKWIEGRKFFDTAFAIFEQMFEISLERRLGDWIERMAKGGATT